MFSGTWRSHKIILWVKLRSKTYCKLSLKFKENRKFCSFFFSKIIFQAKYSNAVGACKMQNLTIWVPNLYEATHLEQFWYPGHHHSSKIEENIKNIKLGEKLAKNVKFLNFWKKIWKKIFFFSQNFHFSSSHSYASRCARSTMRVWKMFSVLWGIQKKPKRVITMLRTY